MVGALLGIFGILNIDTNKRVPWYPGYQHCKNCKNEHLLCRPYILYDMGYRIRDTGYGIPDTGYRYGSWHCYMVYIFALPNSQNSNPNNSIVPGAGRCSHWNNTRICRIEINSGTYLGRTGRSKKTETRKGKHFVHSNATSVCI